MKVVRLAKKRYVIGLWWQLRQGTEDMKRQARSLNQELGRPYTHMALREAQVGMGKGSKMWRGLPSLAAALARGGSSQLLICHFADASCWWVCAIKEGCIAAEGDWTGHSESEALSHAAHLQHMLDLPEAMVIRDHASLQARVVAARGTGKPAMRLLLAFSSQGRLQSLSSPLRFMLMLGSVMATLLALFMAYSAGLFTDDSAARLQKEQRRLEIMRNPGRYFARPWVNGPAVKAWSGRCVNYILQIPFTEKGWDLREASCTGNSATLHWDFTKAASFLHLPEGAELLSPTTASKKQDFEALPTGPAKDLMPRNQVANRLYELARLLGLHLTLNWKDKAKKTITEGSLSVPVVAPWHEGTFTIDNVPSMIILDKDLYEALQTIPGLVLQNLTYTGGSWKIKGLCHGT